MVIGRFTTVGLIKGPDTNVVSPLISPLSCFIIKNPKHEHRDGSVVYRTPDMILVDSFVVC